MDKKVRNKLTQTNKKITIVSPFDKLEIYKKHKDFIFVWDGKIVKPLDYNFAYNREVWTFPQYCKPYLNTFFLDWSMFKYDIIEPNENIICVFKK